MSAALLTRMIEAGTPAEIVAEVAMELGRVQAERELLSRKKEQDRERQRRHRSREVTSSNVRSRDIADKRDTPPKVSPKDINQTPSSPPDVSEAEASSHQPRAWTLPAGVSLQVWTDLKKNRARKRLPNTDTAWKGFLEDLANVSAETGIPPPELIQRCVAKGWGAIYDPRTENDRRTNPVARNQSSDGLSSTTRAALTVFGPIEASH